MHPATLNRYQEALARGEPASGFGMQVLSGCHHFHIGRSVLSVARAMAVHEINASTKAGRAIVFPVISRLPASKLVLTCQGDEGRVTVCILEESDDGSVWAIACAPEGFQTIGGYLPGSDFHEIAGRVRGVAGVVEALLITAMAMSLINEPRIVECSPAAGLDWTRQHRKRVQAVTGQAAMAFSTVRWKIGRRTQAIGNCLTEEGHPKALHWCRAHWRRAQEGQPKAEWVNIPRKGGWGWYCWAADCWKGHPNFGIKLQRHEPYFEGEPRSRYVGGESVLDATRFSAMAAAQRAALFEAGYAPSRALN